MARRRLLLLALAALALLLVIPLTLSGASRRPAPAGLVDGRLRPCPPSPNCVCSEDPAPRAAVEPFSFEGEPADAFRALVALVRAEPRVELVLVEPAYAHAVFRTRFLRFRDDVELRLDAEERVIHVRSASRVGHSDLGANRRRVEALRARWRAAGGGAR
jgi:uncharacterized protein (DUF1499 family)